MRERVSVSAVSSWRASFADDLAMWDRLGVTHVGLSLRKCEEVGLERASEAVREAGLRVSNVVECGWCTLDDPATWSEHQQRLIAALEMMRAVGAPVLVLTTGPAGSLDWDAAAWALGRVLESLRQPAADAGVRLAIENTSAMRLDLSFVTTLRDAVDLAELLDLTVCLELNSCWAERAFAESVARAGARLTHVQVSDALVVSLSTPDRLVPGDGDIPITSRIDALLASNYPGAFEIEMVGPRIEEEGYEAAIGRAIAHMSDQLSRVEDAGLA